MVTEHVNFTTSQHNGQPHPKPPTVDKQYLHQTLFQNGNHTCVCSS